ncbi:alpha-2,8-sialyltransferase 8E-like isoform X2 [Ptychodera flava]|uniref:alpha-2,8-sialyltransferase 8E-like isoform X2 n=1 Tax=Ptychodera flava TaxID=63121 RepID=UPI00396A8654
MLNLLRTLLLTLCFYCIVVTYLTIYSRMSPIRSIDDRRLKSSSNLNLSRHSTSNKTYIQTAPEMYITNATVFTKNSKVVIETSKPNVKTDGIKLNNTIQASKQLITNTSGTSNKKQSETVIDVYKRIKTDWSFNATAAEEFRHLLEKGCRTSEMCLTSHDSVKINDSLQYTSSNGSVLMTPSILNRLPKESPYKWNSFKKCSIVGSSGILLGSQCGKAIDSADFIVRYLGLRNNMTDKFKQDMITEYGNTTLFTEAFNQLHCTPTAFRAQDVLESTHINVVFPHPSYLLLATEFWHGHGIEGNKLTSGLKLVTSFLSFCQEVHLFGFWPFQEDKHGTPLPFHYYDPRYIPLGPKVQGIVHNMPSELNTYINLHNKGIIRLHVDKC